MSRNQVSRRLPAPLLRFSQHGRSRNRRELTCEKLHHLMSHHHKSTFNSHFDPKSRCVKYGLLRRKVVRFGTEDGRKTPRSQTIVQDEVPQIWRAALNVRSVYNSNDQAMVVDPLENHPILGKLEAVVVDFISLADHVPGLALDFVRQSLFDPADLQVIPPFDSDNFGFQDLLGQLAQDALDFDTSVSSCSSNPKWVATTPERSSFPDMKPCARGGM